MKTLFKIFSFCGLGLTVVPAFLVYHAVLDMEQHKMLALAGTILWFVTAPLWLGRGPTG